MAALTTIAISKIDLHAEVYHVPAERAAIQQAIDRASEGDTILVGPGECLVAEPINFRGKSIVLASEGGPDVTVLRYAFTADLNDSDGWCASSRSLVIMESGESFQATLSGFTLSGDKRPGGTLLPLTWQCKPDRSGGKVDMGAGVIIQGGAAPAIVNCSFEDLQSGYGAAIAILGAVVTLKECRITRSTVTSGACLDGFPGVDSGGGAVLVAHGGAATFENCLFEDNFGDNGGALLVQCGARALVQSCTFRNNVVGIGGHQGGAIGCIDSYVEVHQTVFEDGAATNSDHALGGHLWLLEGAEARVYDSKFLRARTRGSGGAIAVVSFRKPTNLHMERCHFEENTASKSGGAIYASGDGRLELINCTFHSSVGNSCGGALCLAGTEARLTGCLMVKSYAPAGAGIYTSRANLVLEGSVILESASDAIHEEGFKGATHMEIRNSILWGATFWPDATSVLFVPSPSVALVEHSIIQGDLWPGIGNMNLDPLLVGPEDAHLQSGSPAIDRGGVTGSLDRDLDGKARPCGEGVDIGVYEFGNCKLYRFRRGDTDGSGTLELSDAVLVLGYLFLGQVAPECRDAADSDDDGELLITDAVFLLSYLFLGGPVPAAPSETCGVDPTADEVFCGASLGCTE